jgi:hypothetical protein
VKQTVSLAVWLVNKKETGKANPKWFIVKKFV